MRVPIALKRNRNGSYSARTLAEPDCFAEGRTREETLENLKNEIRYRLEISACAFLKDNDIDLDVREEAV